MLYSKMADLTASNSSLIFDAPCMIRVSGRFLLGTLFGCVIPAMTVAAPPVPVEIRIAILASTNSLPYQEMVRGFKQAVQRAVSNVVFEERWLQGDVLQAEATAKQLTATNPALFFTVGSLATQSVASAQPGAPMVASMILNAGELKNVPNATGVVLELPIESELRWLRRLLPQQKHVGVMYDPAQNHERVQEAQRWSRILGLRLHAHEVSSPRELAEAMERVANQAQVLWGLTDTLVLHPQVAQSVLLFSFRNRVPFIGPSRSWVKAGALYALERDYSDMGEQSGELAIKVIQGTPADTLRPEAPRKLGYILNLKTARHMKIEFSAQVQKSALEVIE